jgi:hypothetical protein
MPLKPHQLPRARRQTALTPVVTHKTTVRGSPVSLPVTSRKSCGNCDDGPDTKRIATRLQSVASLQARIARQLREIEAIATTSTTLTDDQRNKALQVPRAMFEVLAQSSTKTAQEFFASAGSPS